MSTSTETTVPRLRTDDEIRTLTETEGDFIWIKNIQNSGDHEFIKAAFAYGETYHLTVVSTAICVITETTGSFTLEDMTTELLDKVETITNDTMELIDSKACSNWDPDDFRPLAIHFTANHDEWEQAKTVIRDHGISNYDHLMRIMTNLKDGGAIALADGVL